MKVASVNCITYLITEVINEAYLKFGKLHNVDEKYRPLINMKNEFMLSRLLMTKNKKNYASSVLMQEGRLIEKNQIDIKGLAIKKSNTNKLISNYFTDLLKDDIILSKEINYSNIIKKYFDLIDVVKGSLIKGETNFSIPLRANELSSYEMPLNVMPIRGIATWNILYPEYEISLPTNVNVIKVIIPEDYYEVKTKIEDYCETHGEAYDVDELATFIERLKSAFNYTIRTNKGKEEKDSTLVKNGVLDVISIPKNFDAVPLFLRPFINYEKMVYDHLNSGTIILDCLNIQTPKINDNLIPTNIIKI